MCLQSQLQWMSYIPNRIEILHFLCDNVYSNDVINLQKRIILLYFCTIFLSTIVTLLFNLRPSTLLEIAVVFISVFLVNGFYIFESLNNTVQLERSAPYSLIQYNSCTYHVVKKHFREIDHNSFGCVKIFFHHFLWTAFKGMITRINVGQILPKNK